MFVVISILSWQFSTFYKHIYPAYCVTFAIFAPTGENETRNDYFKCSVCYKQFSRNSHLKDHMLIHTGEKPFECSVCHKQFNCKGACKRHTVLVHKEGLRLSKMISNEEHP